MECNCIKEIEEKVAENHLEWNGKKVTAVKMDTIFTFSQEGCTIRTSTNIVIEVENQKKKYDVGITHTYCPFCGMKQVKEEIINQ